MAQLLTLVPVLLTLVPVLLTLVPVLLPTWCRYWWRYGWRSGAVLLAGAGTAPAPLVHCRPVG